MISGESTTVEGGLRLRLGWGSTSNASSMLYFFPLAEAKSKSLIGQHGIDFW